MKCIRLSNLFASRASQRGAAPDPVAYSVPAATVGTTTDVDFHVSAKVAPGLGPPSPSQPNRSPPKILTPRVLTSCPPTAGRHRRSPLHDYGRHFELRLFFIDDISTTAHAQGNTPRDAQPLTPAAVEADAQPRPVITTASPPKGRAARHRGDRPAVQFRHRSHCFIDATGK